MGTRRRLCCSPTPVSGRVASPPFRQADLFLARACLTIATVHVSNRSSSHWSTSCSRGSRSCGYVSFLNASATSIHLIRSTSERDARFTWSRAVAQGPFRSSVADQ